VRWKEKDMRESKRVENERVWREMMKSEIRNGKKMIKKLQSRRQRNKEVRYERVSIGRKGKESVYC
jgi:fructose-specific phosphotransferase system component IIB